jgi:hypothetical protein
MSYDSQVHTLTACRLNTWWDPCTSQKQNWNLIKISQVNAVSSITHDLLSLKKLLRNRWACLQYQYYFASIFNCPHLELCTLCINIGWIWLQVWRFGTPALVHFMMNISYSLWYRNTGLNLCSMGLLKKLWCYGVNILVVCWYDARPTGPCVGHCAWSIKV